MATNTWVGGTNTKATTATNWSKGEVPKAEDDVVLEGAVNCETLASVLKCRSLKKGASYTGKLIQAGSGINIGDGTAGAGNVALDLTGITYESTGSGGFNFVSSATTAPQTIKWAGASPRSVKVEAGSASTEYTLEDDLKLKERTDSLSVIKGKFISNGHTLDVGTFIGNTSGTRTINIENSLVKLEAETGTLWDFTVVTNLTFAAAGSTIEAIRPGAAAASEALPVFAGNGKTFGALKVLNGATGEQPGLEITGGPTFAGTLSNNTGAKPKTIEGSIAGTTLTVTSGAGNIRKGSGLGGAGVTAGTQVVKELTGTTFELSASQTVAAESMEVFPPGLQVAASTTVTVEGFEGNGASGARAKLASATPGTQFTLKKSNAEQVSVDWMRIRDSKVDASPKWYGGANSVYTNQTNWLEEAPPATGAAVAMLL